MTNPKKGNKVAGNPSDHTYASPKKQDVNQPNLKKDPNNNDIDLKQVNDYGNYDLPIDNLDSYDQIS